jgi:hypothetical protein
MSRRTWSRLTCLCALVLAGLWAMPTLAQQGTEVKEKAPMYSYVADWNVPRAMWKDIEKGNAEDTAILEKYLADGTIVAYGNDVNLVHTETGDTHDSWWSTMSMGSLIKVLTAVRPNGVNNAVYAASKHHDGIFVARYYNWHSGAFTNGYTRVSFWKLKERAPDNALEQLAKGFLVPVLEKLVADGTLYEYEIDEEAVHTTDPAGFDVVVIANGPDALDKYGAAIHDAAVANPFAVTALHTWVEGSAHRDELSWTTAKYK